MAVVKRQKRSAKTKHYAEMVAVNREKGGARSYAMLYFLKIMYYKG